MDLSYLDKGQIRNLGAGGVSKPDVRVTGVKPELLIEIKVDGGWKCGSQAAWQLFQAAELLLTEGIVTRKLAIFGSRIGDPILRKMLDALAVDSAWIQV